MLVVVVALRRGGEVEDPHERSPRSVPAAAAADAAAEIEQLVRAGQKIAAIRRYRALHGVGLAEAKKAIELLIFGGAGSDPADIEGAIDRALLEGRKIAAIKLFRQAHGTDLLTAKKAIERRLRATRSS